MRNIEIKARLADLATARRVAQSIATSRLGVQEQTDTYFHCRQGRLKLREIAGQAAQLVAYSRPDQLGPKTSEYILTPVPEPELLKQSLTATLGVRGVVRKRREIYLYHNVRIHLDEVAGRGEFLEFEAVLSPEMTEADGRSQVAELLRVFAIEQTDLLTGSYGDALD